MPWYKHLQLSPLSIGCGQSECGGFVIAKKIHYKIDKDDKEITVQDVLKRIEEIQKKHPELDVFFDGDEFAICSRPKKKK